MPRTRLQISNEYPRRTPAQNKVLMSAFVALVMCSPSFLKAPRETQLWASESFARQPDVQQILMTVTVTDKKAKPVKGLDKNNFMVFDQNTERKITYFNADRIPASIGIIIDLSGSMSNPHKTSTNIIEFVKEGLVRFTQLLDPSEEYFIITFNKQPELLSDWGENNTKLDTITAKTPRGGTALFDTFHLGIQKVLQGRNQTRLIIIITDGGDNESRTKFTELKHMIQANNLPVYVIGTFFGKPDSNDYDSFIMDQGRLQELTTLSGGQIFLTAAREGVNLAFEAIAEERQAHYQIGFTTTNPTGKSAWHQLKVKVTPPENFPKELQPLVARSREGYIARAPVH
jgi:Ca-activated chloride channel homolog